ncbi:MAG: efflux RND transporter periplasmic adaptor subunit [Verrucomicrobia bacterium]|nr:efflux RND transporter periplasmic adaptor subunit [Verrucomicrobiota bacterium]
MVAGAAAGIVPRKQQQAALRAEMEELAVPTVAVVAPSPGQTTLGLPLSAEIKPWIDAPIYARASGYLKQRLVDIGANVTNGQLLAELDAPELEQNLLRARAELAQAEASLVIAKATAARWAELLRSGNVSEQETAEKDADHKLKVAVVEANKANVRRLADLLSFTRVTAPFDGVVVARNTDVGDLLLADSVGKELFRIAQTHKLRVFVRVPQSFSRSVAPGQTAELTIPELPGRVFAATVVRTSGAMSADSRTLLTELEVDNKKREIFSGSFAQVRLTEAKQEAALTLPANTLLFRAEGPQVGVVPSDNKVELRSVKLGRDFGPIVEILGGVATTDRVILNPSDSLISGATVRIAQ